MTDRPSLGDMSNEAQKMWKCPICGCRDWRTRNSYLLRSGHRRRIKICRHCGHVITTIEEVDDDGVGSSATCS